ncbi:expressed unknown protein [Seminavis robusta]|uniref:Uncharacterized protein n=1 Tax=Seminavis robusta TaxID=568900 RepID=A0A9N8EEG4_9STRA|nr:expressed unknown protein [Seminavis robusta]|eukprot:Sro1062_g236880.1 n/a (749) ;mRNA; f:884-3269
MDSYDPNFNPDTYDPGAPPPAYNDPDMGYIHDDQPPPVPADPYDPAAPGVDAGVYDDAPHPGYDDDPDHDVVYGDDDPRYGAYPDGDVPHHVGGEYEPDENGNYGDGFDDDDDVYLDNTQRNQSIGNVQAKDGMGEVFWRNCIGCCTCLFLLCGLIILGVRIGEISEEDAKKTHVVIHGKVGLIPPPKDLAIKCTHERVLSEKGFYECEQLCEVADCCNYPTTLALSCLAGNDDECLEYHQHCNVLDLDTATILNPPPTPPASSVPEAPKDIENKCNIESLRTVPGFEGCVNDCMQAECCWKKDGSVHPCTSLAVCSGYASCLTMDVTDHVNIDINREIQDKCADSKLSTEVGRNQCIFACSHAACCFDPGATCPHQDARFCSQYQACQKIFDDNGQVIQGGSAAAAAAQIPVAPQFLDTACSKSSLDTLPGYEMCLGACTEAECCWKNDAKCLGESACDGYHHCVSLLDQGATSAPEASSIPAAPQYLAAACSSASLDTNAGFQMCQDACMKAECCWKVTSCSEKAECSSYATHCANLVARLDQTNAPVDAVLPEAPHDLDQTCAATTVLAPSGFSKCQTECEKTECCWKAGAPDSCVANSGCQPWAPCTVMNGAQDPTAAAAQDYTIEQVFDACLNHDNNVGKNHTSLCQVVCQAGTCCFDESKDCPTTIDCKVFEPCQVLHKEKATQVETACGGDDLAECVGVCAAATCCFTNDIAKICDITSPDVVCRQYKACEILYKAELSNP